MAKKEFKAGVYAVTVGIVLAVILTALTVFAFATRYTALSPEKVAQTYVDTIVQTGDGYNAYKNTLVSKNQKYGDFIRNAYMRPYVNDTAEKADFVGTGSKEEQEAIDTVYNTMYDYLVELINGYGFDNYDMIFGHYFAKLAEVRRIVYGDEYMDMDYMFGAFEANVASYGESLTGRDEKLADDGKTVLREAMTGRYQEMFGEDYRLTASVKSLDILPQAEADEYITAYKERIAPIAESGEARAEAFGLEDTVSEKKILFFTKKEKKEYKTAMINAFAKLDSSEAIDSVAKAVVEVKLDDGTVAANQEVFVVKIGNSWYVDNTNADTSGLYLAR